jgi:hypothetical protein
VSKERIPAIKIPQPNIHLAPNRSANIPIEIINKENKIF